MPLDAVDYAEKMRRRHEKTQATVAARAAQKAGDGALQRQCEMAASHRSSGRWFLAAALDANDPMARARFEREAARFADQAQRAAAAAGGWRVVNRMFPARNLAETERHRHGA